MKKERQTDKIKMNLPNKLTILRIILVPVIVLVYMAGISYGSLYKTPVFSFWPNFSWLNFIVLVIFGIAAFTDKLNAPENAFCKSANVCSSSIASTSEV